MDYDAMEVILLDSTLIDRSGHSWRMIEEIGAALRARGLRYRTFVPKAVEPEIIDAIGVIPHFSQRLYDAPHIYSNNDDGLDNPVFWILDKFFSQRKPFFVSQIRASCSFRHRAHLEALDWKELNLSYAKDLAALPKNVWSPENLVIVTATSQNQLSGLIKFLRARDKSQLPRIICHLMLPPRYSPAGFSSRLGEKFYRRAFRRGKALTGSKLFFTTENKGMQALFSETFGLQTEILPVPLHVGKAELRDKDGPARLGFYGSSRYNKGFHLLPGIVMMCRQRRYDVTFNVQIQYSNHDEAMLSVERTLRDFSNVRLIKGAISTEEYIRLFDEADIILLPYDPVEFGMQGSGVFTEAMTAGCPIIASKDTFAAKSIEQGEAQGEVFAPYTAAACVDAIGRLLSMRSELQAKALSKAHSFARTHCGATYIERSLRVAGY